MDLLAARWDLLDAVRPLHPRATTTRRVHTLFTHAHLRPARGSTPSAQLFGMPYSEHSSFFELTCFALSLDWARIVPTVNVESAVSRAKISTWIARWEAERRKRSLGIIPPVSYPGVLVTGTVTGLSGCLAGCSRRVLS